MRDSSIPAVVHEEAPGVLGALRAEPPSPYPPPRGAREPAAGELGAADDEAARELVLDALQLVASRCFAEASALRERASRVSSRAACERAAARSERAGRYAEAAAAWLARNGANALLGQAALLDSVARHAAHEPKGGPR